MNARVPHFGRMRLGTNVPSRLASLTLAVLATGAVAASSEPPATSAAPATVEGPVPPEFLPEELSLWLVAGVFPYLVEESVRQTLERTARPRASWPPTS